jgi:hypothetical protein
MLLNPTLGSTGGSGPGPDPDPIDVDVEILVGTDAPSFAAARALAMTYRGRMAYGRHVTIRLPAGVTTISDPADLRFTGIDFPELRILGHQPWGYTAQSVTVSAYDEVTQAYDLTFLMNYVGGIDVDDMIVVTADVVAAAAHRLSALASVCGCHEIVATTETSVTVRVGSNSALWVVADATVSASDLGSSLGYLSVYKMPSILAMADTSELLGIRRSRLDGFGDFVLRAASGGYASGVVIEDSTLSCLPTSILAVLPDGLSEGYGSALSVERSEAHFGSLVLAPHTSGAQWIEVKDGGRLRVDNLLASMIRMTAAVDAVVRIDGGLASGVPGLPWDSDLTLTGPVDFYCPQFLYVMAASEMLVTASRGARVWLSDPIELAMTSPAPGQAGNDGATIYFVA